MEMEKAWSYLRKIADARVKLIASVKDDLEVYQCELVRVMMETEAPVKLIDLGDLEPLYTVAVPPEILNALGDDCQSEPAFARYIYKYVVIDGIKLKATEPVLAKTTEEVA